MQPWLYKAREPKEACKRKVQKELTGPETEGWEITSAGSEGFLTELR